MKFAVPRRADADTALRGDPPGFDRRTLDGAYAAITGFFVQNLQP